MKARILYAEDDRNLGFVTKDNLEINGYEVSHLEDGESAWETFKEGGFDLCLLDVMMPDTDGFTLAERIRKLDKNIPVIFLTAKSLKEDRLTGLRLGADDYLTKPFSIEELILKIEIFLRRKIVTNPAEEKEFEIGIYRFDADSLRLAGGGEERKLTARENELLKMFCLAPGRVLRREEILVKIWGEDDYFAGRSLDVFISRLRKYLKNDPAIQLENIHGVGFRINIEAKNQNPA